MGIRRRFVIGNHSQVEFTTHRSWRENGTYRNPYIMIDFLYVSSEHRRRGYATQLVNKVKEVAREAKLPIILAVIPYADKPLSTTELYQMYAKMGFKRTFFENMKWEPEPAETTATEILQRIAA